MWTTLCYFNLGDVVGNPGASLILGAGPEPTPVEVAYLGDKVGNPPAPPGTIETYTIPANGACTVPINCDNPAFGPLPRYGAIQVRSTGSGVFCAYLAYADGASMTPVSGAALQGHNFCLPFLDGTLRAKILVTNLAAAAASVTIMQPGGTYTKTETVPHLYTWRWDTRTEHVLPTGEIAICSTATVVASAIVNNGAWIYHVALPVVC